MFHFSVNKTKVFETESSPLWASWTWRYWYDIEALFFYSSLTVQVPEDKENPISRAEYRFTCWDSILQHATRINISYLFMRIRSSAQACFRMQISRLYQGYSNKTTIAEKSINSLNFYIYTHKNIYTHCCYACQFLSEIFSVVNYLLPFIISF